MFVTQDDYKEWLESPVTKWVFSQIETAKEDVKNRVVKGSGVFFPGDAAKTTASMAQMIGFVQGLDELKRVQPRGKK